MTSARLTIVINYRSPFCALVIDRLFDIQRRYRVDTRWVIVKEVPRPSSFAITEDNPRFGYNRQDCDRRAAWLGIPWNPPAWRLNDVEAASRLGQWLLTSGSPYFEAYSKAVIRAYWSNGRNISDPAVVVDIAREVGVSEADQLAATQALEVIDEALAANAAWCTQQRVLGVPSFLVDDQQFWGSDRLGALDRYLAERGLGATDWAIDAQILYGQQPGPVVPVIGREAAVAVNRIFCVGRNYADHAREMGADPTREPPFFFMKPVDALVLSGASIAYPPGTQKYEYEMELAVVIGEPLFAASPEQAQSAIFGYAPALDMTRRDLQLQARDKGRPWELGKSFKQSAVIGPIRAALDLDVAPSGPITLKLNGDLKQSAQISDMIWSVSEIVANLSQYYDLVPGDLILTGTPAGVGPTVPGDEIRGEIADVGSVVAHIVAADDVSDAEQTPPAAGLEVAAR